MAAIREINPGALLVQTEDLGRTYSTPALAYQGTFDNNRRWLTLDLLSGRLDQWHPLWWYLLESGIQRQELESHLERPCVPDIIGINHYVTSDRYLDDRIELYPPHSRGGNGRHAYADVEAVRILEDEVAGHEGALRNAWDRYGIPLAITEVHLGCTREEQLRWLNDAWTTANRLRLENVDIRAVTVWALLGCYGWSSLLTSRFEHYESGAFDLRSPQPRPTALARMTHALATTGVFDHPVLEQPGWWRRKSRLMHPSRENFGVSAAHPEPNHSGRPILITGCNGTLGSAFQRVALDRGMVVHAAARDELDIRSRSLIATILGELKPWAVINAAGFVRVDDAEHDARNCYQVNTEGAAVLAEECAHLDIPLAVFSSDLVFDGRKTDPYVESDSPSPLNIYGASKARLEKHVKTLPNCLVVRTSAFFGPWDQHNFLATTFREIAEGNPVYVANDSIVSPTYIPDLVNTTLDLIIDGERGIWHVANEGALTWYEFAKVAADRADVDSRLIVGRPTNELGSRARRPLNSALASERGKLIPKLDDAIDRWLATVTAGLILSETLEKSGSV
jgi:dTDP-4-dehydrorhamnose reductase